MSESLKIALTAAVTLLGGLILFGLERFILEPLNAQLAVISKIGYLLIFHAEQYANPAERGQLSPEERLDWAKHPRNAAYDEARVEIRRVAAELCSATNRNRAYRFWRAIGMAVPEQDIKEAHSLLIGISNNLISDGQSREGTANCDSADRIKKLLRLDRVLDKSAAYV